MYVVPPPFRISFFDASFIAVHLQAKAVPRDVWLDTIYSKPDNPLFPFWHYLAKVQGFPDWVCALRLARVPLVLMAGFVMLGLGRVR
jgi:hypothetical protein